MIPGTAFFSHFSLKCSHGTSTSSGKDFKILVGENTMIGPFVFITSEAFSHSKQNPERPHSGHAEDINIGKVFSPGIFVFFIWLGIQNKIFCVTNGF